MIHLGAENLGPSQGRINVCDYETLPGPPYITAKYNLWKAICDYGKISSRKVFIAMLMARVII